MHHSQDALGQQITSDETVVSSKKTQESWLENNADEISKICAVIPFLSLGILTIIFLTNGFSSYAGLVFAAIAVIALIISIILLFKSSKTIAETDRESHANTRYVISYWSIETLKAVGVPEDLTNGLKEILRESETFSPLGEVVVKNLSDDSPDNWLEKLKKRYGETRVDEFSEVIMKYTRREISEDS